MAGIYHRETAPNRGVRNAPVGQERIKIVA
jgi:hypothetical protein